jgi:hypothetical protein
MGRVIEGAQLYVGAAKEAVRLNLKNMRDAVVIHLLREMQVAGIPPDAEELSAWRTHFSEEGAASVEGKRLYRCLVKPFPDLPSRSQSPSEVLSAIHALIDNAA